MTSLQCVSPAHYSNESSHSFQTPLASRMIGRQNDLEPSSVSRYSTLSTNDFNNTIYPHYTNIFKRRRLGRPKALRLCDVTCPFLALLLTVCTKRLPLPRRPLDQALLIMNCSLKTTTADHAYEVATYVDRIPRNVRALMLLTSSTSGTSTLTVQPGASLLRGGRGYSPQDEQLRCSPCRHLRTRVASLPRTTRTLRQ